MRYDILEYFSIYGTALSIWVSLMGKHWSLMVPTKHQHLQVRQDLSASLVGQLESTGPRNGVAFELLSARISSEIVFYGSQPVLWFNPLYLVQALESHCSRWGSDTHESCPEWWLGKFCSWR